MNKIALFAAVLGSISQVSSAHGGQVLVPQESGTQLITERDQPLTSGLSDFDGGMEALSRKDHITLIAEDQPLKARLTASEAKVLVGVLADAPTKEGRIMAFSRQFDYDIIPYNKDCYLLRKRYTSGDDLPRVSLGEWRESLSDVLSLLRPFSPELGDLLFRDPAVKSLISSLTARQIETMQSDGVPVVSLSLAQRDCVRSLCLFSYIQQPLTRLDTFKEQTDLATRKGVVVGWFGEKGTPHKDRVFAFVDPVSYAQKKPNSFLPLSHDDVGWSGHFTIGAGFDTLGARDETAPTMAGSLRRSDVSRCESQTLAEMCQSLIVADRGVTDGGLRFAVAPVLAEKPVTITGKQYISAPSLFRAVGLLYGLRTRYVSKDQIYYLERERIAPVTNVTSLRDAVRQALPMSYLSCLETMSLSSNHSTPSGRSPRQWRIEAVRHLRELTEPFPTASKQNTMLVSRLGGGEVALTNVLMADAATTLKVLAVSPTPAYLNDFQHVVLTGGPNRQDDMDWFSIGVQLPRADKSLQPFFGINVLAHEPVTAK